jgi:hypothetical protein
MYFSIFALASKKSDTNCTNFHKLINANFWLIKLKSTVNDAALEKEFSVTLYPNSAFLIPLSTNRLYTHEIKPSVLNVDHIPVRMGYVARCSNLEALHRNGQTYIKENGELLELADDDQKKEFFKLRGQENSIMNFTYPKLSYTLSAGDTIMPKI